MDLSFLKKQDVSLTEEEKREKLLRENNQNRHKSRSFFRKLILAFVLINGAFFLSGLLPTISKTSDFTLDPDMDISIGNKNYRIIRFEYCKEEQVAEVEIDFKPLEFEEGKFTISALQNQKDLPYKQVYKNSDTYIFQISNLEPGNFTFLAGFIPKSGDTEKSEEMISTDRITQSKSLPVLSAQQYLVKRLNWNINYYKKKIDAIQKSITDLKNKAADIVKLNQDITNNMAFQAEEDQTESKDRLDKNKDQIIDIQNSITKSYGDITTYQDNIRTYNLSIQKAGKE